MTEQNKQPPAEAGEGAIAYAVYGINHLGEHYVRGVYPVFKDWGIDDCGLGDRWAGNELLYTSQTTATQAAVAAAMRKAAREVYSFTGLQEATRSHLIERILSSIPAEANIALERICMEVAKQAAEFGCYPCDDDELLNQLRAIVASILLPNQEG
jgi:hypothetical protein